MTTSRISPSRRLLGAIAGVTLAAGTLAACGPEDSAEFDPADQTQEPAEDAEQAPDVADGPDGDEQDADDDEKGTADDAQAEEVDAASGGTYVRGPEDAAATITYDLPDGEMQVTVGLHSLQVEGDVMRLDLSFSPEGGRDSDYTLYTLNQNRRLRPVLNDRENLKQYSVLEGSGDTWSSDSTPAGTKVESGQTLMYHAYYAAPEDDIDTIDVLVIDGLVEFSDAQVEW
ncbi:hypothetical protein [Pseudactinotalea sp. Z1732]|uniref:hypothetical protein n=1 Tax=Micrococcales TaxID=85006 RepID=UPI003C7CFBC7